MNSNVQPRKIIRPKPQAWTCKCLGDHGDVGLPQPGYMGRCFECGMKRP